MRELPTIEAVANASSDKLHKLWEGLGYYTRVRNLQKAAQVIIQEHGGKFPQQFDEVLALPGIGRYTAGAICSIAFNQPTPLLDGNVIRVFTRVFGIADNPKEKQTNAQLWELAETLVIQAQKDQTDCSSRREEALTSRTSQSVFTSAAMASIGNCSALNQSLMELGALICTPRNSQCLVCPVKKLCVAFKENRVDSLPNLGEREQATARHFKAFVIELDGKFLVRQRPAGIVNAHLWEFPNVEVNGSKATPKAVFKTAFGVVAEKILPLLTVKHSITRYRITLEAFKVNASQSAFPEKNGVWKTPAQMQALAFTAAHKRLASAAIQGIMTNR